MTRHSPVQICVVEDDLIYAKFLEEILTSHGYEVRAFASASSILETPAHLAELERSQLVISDIKMPGATGYDLCRAIRSMADRFGHLPVVLVTGNNPAGEKSKGLEAGADDFISKPFRTPELLAKIRSLLRIRGKELATMRELRTAKGMNDRLQRFITPNVADLLALESLQPLLKPHRAEVSVVFVDLRRFTAFSEAHEPEIVLEVLSAYYGVVGEIAMRLKGTVGHLAGDGIMVFFNDPEPQHDHQKVAVNMALEVRQALVDLRRDWKHRGFDIDFGMGVNAGLATTGAIGFEQLSSYTVIGPVTNIAARLCNAAQDGQILATVEFLANLPEVKFPRQQLGEIQVKGVVKPIAVCNLLEPEESKIHVA